MKTKLVGSVVTMMIGYLTAPSVLFATVPDLVRVHITDLSSSGPISDVSGTLVVSATENVGDVAVKLIYADRSPRDSDTQTRVSEEQTVSADKPARIEFSVTLNTPGKHRVPLFLEISTINGFPLGTHQEILYFEAEDGSYRRSTYDRLYQPQLVAIEEGEPPVMKTTRRPGLPEASLVPLPDDLVEGPNNPALPRRTVHLPQGHAAQYMLGSPHLQETVVAPGTVIDQETVGTSTHVLNHSSQAGAEISTPEEHQSVSLEEGSTPASILIAPAVPQIQHTDSSSEHLVAPGTVFHVRGRVEYIGLDGDAHPGYKWYVRLRGTLIDGRRATLASGYANELGEWSFRFANPFYAGQNLSIIYRLGNGYVSVNMLPLIPYRLYHGEYPQIGEVHDAGTIQMDFSNTGFVPGLGDVYTYANKFWRRLSNIGISPLREEPITIFFPNFWYDCENGTGIPWSCSSDAGIVYIAQGHVSSPSDPYGEKGVVVMHELGHQLMAEYWDNEGPKGAGGSHNGIECRNPGLALSEGFATAIGLWGMYGSDAAPYLENLNPQDICPGLTNENWVAATFWDLMDSSNDNLDEFAFIQPGWAFSVILDHGKENSMWDFFADYRFLSLLTTGERDPVTKVYLNNFMHVWF